MPKNCMNFTLIYIKQFKPWNNPKVKKEYYMNTPKLVLSKNLESRTLARIDELTKFIEDLTVKISTSLPTRVSHYKGLRSLAKDSLRNNQILLSELA